MPHWTKNQEEVLATMITEGKFIEEIARVLKRTPEAIAIKAKRSGLPAPARKKCFAKNLEKKNSFSEVTTTTKLEPVPASKLPSANEMLGLLVAAIYRLQQPDVGREEWKKLRLIIQAVKAYIHLEAGIVFRLRHVESDMLGHWRHIAAHYQTEIERAQTEEEKAKFKALLQDAQEQIRELREMGVAEPKRLSPGLASDSKRAASI